MIDDPHALNDIYGNTLGLKPSELKRLRNSYRRRVGPHDIVSPELARHLCELSRETNRQIGVLLDRRGAVEWVIVGNAHKLELPDIGRARAGQVRLRGLRLVHTHLKSEPLTKDDLTDLALLRLDMVAAVGVGEDGLPGVLHYAHLVPEKHRPLGFSLWVGSGIATGICAGLVASRLPGLLVASGVRVTCITR